MRVILRYPQLNVGTLHARVTSTRPSLASKDQYYEYIVIPSILKRGYYHPHLNVGTLHVVVTSVEPSLASKATPMNIVLYLQDNPQERILSSTSECQTLSAYSSILFLFHTGASLSSVIDDNLIITPHFLGGSILSTSSPFI